MSDQEPGAVNPPTPRVLSAWERWYPAFLCGLGGAAAAMAVDHLVLDRALLMRPPIVVADYAPFLEAVGHGVRPEALKPLAEAYTQRAQSLAAHGALVVSGDFLAALPPGLVLAHDPAEIDLVLAASSGAAIGSQASVAGPPGTAMAGQAPLGPRDAAVRLQALRGVGQEAPR